MERSRVDPIPMPTGAERARSVMRVTTARRRLERVRERRARTRGRAWVNGSEVGGEDGRFGHLERSHD
jgi:hypothetical protein